MFSELRLLGVEDVKEVKQATLEPNGKISVIKKPKSKPIQQRGSALASLGKALLV